MMSLIDHGNVLTMMVKPGIRLEVPGSRFQMLHTYRGPATSMEIQSESLRAC